MRRTLTLAVSIALAAGSAASASDAAAARRKGKPAAAAPDKAGTSHKALFASHLRQRLKKIADGHASRLRFIGREMEAWQGFWDKVKSERTIFEERMARQGLALFDSLSSLDPKDHPSHIANYERLQSDVIKSFESRQRERLAEFFAERREKLDKAASEQERERADFAAEAEVAWQEHKAKLRVGRAPPAAVEAAEPAVEEAPESVPQERPVLEKPQSPMKTKKPKSVFEDRWH